MEFKRIFSNKVILIPFTVIIIIGLAFSSVLLTTPPTASEFSWKTSSPDTQGLNSTILNNMIEYVNTSGMGIHAIVLIKNDFMVLENYFFGFDETRRHEIWSCTKSVSSALIGIAIDQGLIEIDDVVIDLFPDKTFDNIDARKQRLTIRHLLTMSTGLEWAGDTEYVSMYSESDWVQYVLDKPMIAEPGTIYNYHTGGSHLLAAIIEEVTGNTTMEFANQFLFSPLGITSATWQVDPQGIARGGSGLFMTPRDMARFGRLYLHNGLWNDQQIISENWISESTKMHFHDYYGYQWWLQDQITPKSYAAFGYLGQVILNIPEYNMTAIFTSDISAGYGPMDLVNDYILLALI
ncbi:MAG: serine hydrolase domain-containing protein [Candidatus Hodarchaeales archaeon]|jgi:CubicO group peptidase (beta-lactamase class C family)